MILMTIYTVYRFSQNSSGLNVERLVKDSIIPQYAFHLQKNTASYATFYSSQSMTDQKP
jgi:hypothetical protein